MALVIDPALPKATRVTNLGWLRNHWKEVISFTVFATNDETRATDAWMVAHLSDGRVYVTDWASSVLMQEWLHRPIFRGLPLNWFGAQITC